VKTEKRVKEKGKLISAAAAAAAAADGMCGSASG